MKKLIISLAFTATLPLFQVAVAQGSEITHTLSHQERTELQQNVCNDSGVNYILSSNEPYESALTDALVLSGSYYQEQVSLNTNDDDDDDDGGGSAAGAIFAANEIDTTIMPDSFDTSPQDEIANLCP
ncbi:MAG: hypothetical protein QNJ55_07970 [Xenococcus sp. MO_188.B8]|nr:hypothetical protein [Xenococcus sp. MO_188.B8]